MEVRLYQNLLEFNWNLSFSMITVLVLYLILKKFFFEKVYYVLEARQVHIEEQLAHARDAERKAEGLLEEYSRTLTNTEEEKRKILREARQSADARAANIVENAQKEAAELTERTHAKLAHEEEKILHQVQQDIAQLAILAAEQILQRELGESDHTELISKMIEEAETGKWEIH
jgi:F-type H+-transporting ATPase subunit b